jgi:hypothetical protein
LGELPAQPQDEALDPAGQWQEQGAGRGSCQLPLLVGVQPRDPGQLVGSQRVGTGRESGEVRYEQVDHLDVRHGSQSDPQAVDLDDRAVRCRHAENGGRCGGGACRRVLAGGHRGDDLGGHPAEVTHVLVVLRRLGDLQSD